MSFLHSILYALRAGLAFGIAALLPAVADAYAPGFGWAGITLIAFAGGAIGAILLFSSEDNVGQIAIAFGIGFVVLWLTCLITPFLFVALGGLPWLGWALAFALGGGIGGRAIRESSALLGALTFGVGGFIGGVIFVGLSEQQLNRADMVYAMGLAGLVGGALFGALVRPTERTG